jgi:hypothetical protein
MTARRRAVSAWISSLRRSNSVICQLNDGTSDRQLGASRVDAELRPARRFDRGTAVGCVSPWTGKHARGNEKRHAATLGARCETPGAMPPPLPHPHIAGPYSASAASGAVSANHHAWLRGTRSPNHGRTGHPRSRGFVRFLPLLALVRGRAFEGLAKQSRPAAARGCRTPILGPSGLPQGVTQSNDWIASRLRANPLDQASNEAGCEGDPASPLRSIGHWCSELPSWFSVKRSGEAERHRLTAPPPLTTAGEYRSGIAASFDVGTGRRRWNGIGHRRPLRRRRPGRTADRAAPRSSSPPFSGWPSGCLCCRRRQA